MKNSIAREFGFFSLLKFALPSMVMMVFMSLYTIADGIFVSRMVGSLALSSVNVVYPVANVVMAAGIMLATGGSAIIARKLGEKRRQEARENFTVIVLTGVLLGCGAMLLGNLLIEPLCRMLGATDLLMEYCKEYLRVILCFAPMCMLQMLFQSFFVTAGKPGLGLCLIVAGGVANVVLDYLFMGPLQMGIGGAALATGLGQCIPAAAGVFYFFFCRRELYFVKPKWNAGVLAGSCLNGSSEMVTNLSTAVITYLFNVIMLRLAGEEGVAAITVVLYGQFLFNALYLGYSLGVAPVFSYHFGCKNKKQLERLYRISLGFVAGSSLVVTVIALAGSGTMAGIFLERGTGPYELAGRGCFLFALNYLSAGINIMASGIFTALSDGKTSALISFLRTFVFIVAAALILPYFLGTDGVWLSIPLAETLTLAISLPLLISAFRKQGEKIFSRLEGRSADYREVQE